MNIEARIYLVSMFLEKKMEVEKVSSEIETAFGSFIDLSVLRRSKRKPAVKSKAFLFLAKKLKENLHNSGIENCGTAFMLEEIGRGMVRYSRRLSWLNRHYEWSARVPVFKKRRARVLDLGCDVGEIRKIMSGSFYYKNPLYVGVDIDDERLTQGFEAVGASRTPVMFIQHDITFPLNFVKSNSVDCIFLGETLEHFEEKYAILLLKEMHRVLRKRGKYFISTPVRRNSKGYDFHVYEYNPEELVKILKNIGFSVTRTYGWVTTEKVLKKRMSEEDWKIYQRMIKKAHKDIVLPVIVHLNPNYADAFCVEGQCK